MNIRDAIKKQDFYISNIYRIYENFYLIRKIDRYVDIDNLDKKSIKSLKSVKCELDDKMVHGYSQSFHFNTTIQNIISHLNEIDDLVRVDKSWIYNSVELFSSLYNLVNEIYEFKKLSIFVKIEFEEFGFDKEFVSVFICQINRELKILFNNILTIIEDDLIIEGSRKKSFKYVYSILNINNIIDKVYKKCVILSELYSSIRYI